MITAFLPCRAGSVRVPGKNTKTFAGVEGGLLRIKLNHLLDSNLIDRIILSSNDPEVLKLGAETSKEIIIHERPEHLALSSTSTDSLINYVPSIIKEGHVLWTHTTSPFITSQVYNKAITIYQQNILEKTYDSLLTVSKLQTFLWNENGSFNYDRIKEKWPRTQTIKELYEINSGIFLNSIENFKRFKDRIGEKPYLLPTNRYESFDIDWPDDFSLGEMIYEKIHKK